MGSDELLGDLLAACLGGGPLSPTVRNWLINGIVAAVRRDQPLDESLGLSGPGKPTLHRRIQMIRRDAHLVRACQSVALDGRVTDWQKCKRLASEARRFSQIIWPRTRRLAAPDPDWPAFKKSLWLACSTDLQLPTSATRIRAIVLQAGGFSQNECGSKILANLL
ncbi:MAG: hypothetical protein IPN53_25210 [Comamonadaceae bacterium]|nr:hypothetical protein [Comamonadaceae bacterium]